MISNPSGAGCADPVSRKDTDMNKPYLRTIALALLLPAVHGGYMTSSRIGSCAWRVSGKKTVSLHQRETENRSLMLQRRG